MHKRVIAFFAATALMAGSFMPAATLAVKRPTPTQALQLLVDSMQKPDAFGFNGHVSFSYELVVPKTKVTKKPIMYIVPDPYPAEGLSLAPAPTKRGVKLNFEGYSDTLDKNVPKHYSRYTLPEFSLLGENPPPDAFIDYMTIDKVLYFDVHKDIKHELFASSSMPVPDDAWIKVDLEQILKEYGIDAKTTNKVTKGRDMNPAQKLQLIAAFNRLRPLTMLNRPDANVEGVSAYVFQFQINKGKILPFLKEAGKIMKEPMSKDEEKKINTMLAKVKVADLPKFNVAFDKNTLKVKRISVDHTVSIPNKDTKETMVYKFSYERNYTHMEVVPAIVAPDKTVDAVELYKAYKTKSDFQKKDSYRYNDLRRLQSSMEIFYTNHGYYPPGTYLSLGTPETRCLNAQGWQPEGCSSSYHYWVYTDPDKNYYKYTSTGQDFYIDAQLTGEYLGYTGTIRLTPQGVVQR